MDASQGRESDDGGRGSNKRKQPDSASAASRDALNGDWRSKKDTQHRREVFQCIALGLKHMFAPNTEYDSDKIPRLVKQLEVILYRSAPSFEAYADTSTLKHRLHLSSMKTISRHEHHLRATAAGRERTASLGTTRRRLPFPTSWADQLPTDLIGTVGTFLDAPSFLNYAITAGPKLGRILKKAFLKKNFDFLLWHVENSNIFSAFLEVNEEWKDFYDKPELLSLSDRQYFHGIFNDIRFAISLGHVELVKHLIEVRGVDINGISRYIGNIYDVDVSSEPLYVPLFFKAIESVKLPVLEYLLSNEDLDVNAKTIGGPVGFEGLSCLHFVARKFITETQHETMPDFVSLLLSHSDIDVNAITGVHGFTALHMAAGLSNADKHLLPLLLSHEEINVNATTIHGYSPLHIAVRRWRREEICEENVKDLIKAGADAEIRHAINNQMPLDYASEDQAALIKKWMSEAVAAVLP